jgi:hypothetical protein
MNLRGRRLLPLLLGAVLPAGCDARDIRAPAPEVGSVIEAPAPDLPPAFLSAPVVLDLTRILAELEEAVPDRFGDLEERIDHPENDRVRVAFLARRSPFTTAMVGEEARMSATVSYQVRAWYNPPLLPEVSVSCGTGEDEPMPRAVLEMRSPLTLDQDWILRSRVRLERLEPASDEDRDQCDVTPLGIGVTGTVMRAAAALLEGERERIDARVAEVDVRGRLQEVWETLQEPHELTDGVWLMVNPLGVTRGRTVGEGRVLTIQVGLTARPRLVVGPRPTVTRSPIPDLHEGELPEEARILIEGVALYTSVGERLTEELGGQELSWGGNTVRLLDLGLHPIGGGRVALEVSFDGSARGTVFLVGTPRLDRGAGVVQVPDLEFDVRTRNLLVGGLAWLAGGNLEAFLRERARVPVAEIMTLAEEQLHRGINRSLSDEVTVEGEVLGSDLLEVLADGPGLLVRASASVRAVLRIQQTEEPPPESSVVEPISPASPGG